MADDGRMMNFVSEKQLHELKEARGVRPEDGTVSIDKPLWEILKANKEAKDAEWTEKHRHKTQKALDEDEVYFLDAVDMHQREQEKLQQEAEMEELAAFQAALLEKQLGSDDPPIPKQRQSKISEMESGSTKTKRPTGKPLDVLASMVKLKPQPKKQRTESPPRQTSLQRSNEVKSRHIEQSVQSGLLGLQTYEDDDTDDDTKDEVPA